MLGLLKAEWRKVTRNYLVTSFLVWIFPVGLAVWMVSLAPISVVSRNIPRNMLEFTCGNWTSDLIGIWSFVTSFPLNVLGRMLPVAFMAVVFGGEYQWGTWRNTVPRNDRAALISAKLLIASAIVVIAFEATSFITVSGCAMGHTMLDLPYAPNFTISEALQSLQAYAEQTLLGFLSLLILADFAELTGEPALATSLLVVFGWVVALAFGAILVFQRQDITC